MFKYGSPLTLALMLAIGAMAAGCASTGAVPQPFPRAAGSGVPIPPPPAGVTAEALPPAAISTTTSGYAIAGTALALRGSPYRNGGTDPRGFDCSGFISYVFAQNGIRLGRTVSEQFREGVSIAPEMVEAGDLVFFSTENPGPSHVGMAIGGDSFVHAPSSHGEVRVERFSTPYWSSRFVGARRVR